MIELFSDEMRRNPYPIYERMRSASPVLHAPPPFDMWMIFDYDGGKRVVNDYETFSSAVPAPDHWFEGDEEASTAISGFTAVTAEMDAYLAKMIAQRRELPRDDVLTRLMEAEVDGERLTQAEILGFFQLLIVAGQETTTNLINNAVLCLIENPDQLARLRAAPELLSSAIEEVLRYRSPLQWLMRTPRHDTKMHAQVIPAGQLVLAMVGSANRDPKRFDNPDKFDITRHPNPHLAFGQGIHACLGAALARMESRIALSELLARLKDWEPGSDEPWQPRKALHVHGPTHLPIRFQPAMRE